jgi:transposase
MVGKKDRSGQSLFTFVPGDIIEHIPEDHLLRRVDRVLKLSWVTDEVRDAYSPNHGAPSVDPEVVIRLLIVGYLYNITHVRELLREVQVNIAMRWYVGYGLDETLPDHSSLSKIAVRWGEARFRRIYQRVVKACIDAGLVDGKTVHIDATLIRANASWSSLVAVPVATDPTVETATTAGAPAAASVPTGKRKAGRPRTKPPKTKKRSTTDPEATLATSNRNRKLEPCYKQHTAVDDKHGVVVDVDVTTGEANEGEQLLAQMDRVEANTGVRIETVTGDAGYAHGSNYEQLEQRQVAAVIPPQAEPRHPKHIPIRRFKYDARHQFVRCPGGRQLDYTSESERGQVYTARREDCRGCPLRRRCFSATESARMILIVPGYEALLRARRYKVRGWAEVTREQYHRHRWRVEGKHAEAKERHGLRRAVRRGRAKVAIQAYLTAIVMNLKLLAGLLVALRNWLSGLTAGESGLLTRRPDARESSVVAPIMRIAA